MPDLATLRLTWEPRLLSILRMMVGLLYMEHGLAKVLGSRSSPTMRPVQSKSGPPRLVGAGWRIAARAGFVHPHRRLYSRGQYGGRLFHGARAERLPRCSTAASWQSSTASSSFISGLPAAANGASIEYARLHPPYRRAGPERGSAATGTAFNLPARMGQLLGVSL